MRTFLFPVLLLAFGAPLTAQETAALSADSAQRVYTGIYLMNVYDLDINAYSFYADFYLWFRWKGELDPTHIEFVNAVEKWGFTEMPFYDEPRLLPDGYYYNGLRFEGRFYHSFVLHRFPLDRHQLDIRIENTEYSIDSLVYVPDTSTSLFRTDFKIPGWVIQDAHMTTHTNFYQTNFGEPPAMGGSKFSNYTFMLTIARPLSYFVLKLMLPLLIVILACLGALFIHPEYTDGRISLPIGGLLSCVFLQQSYSSALPDVGYMVLMDRIYLVAYVLIAAILLRVILTGNKLATPEGIDINRIQINDRRRAAVLFLLFSTAIGLLVILN